MLAAALLLASLLPHAAPLWPLPVAALGGDGAPSWLADRFVRRTLERARAGEPLPLELLADRVVDAVVQALPDGRFAIELRQPGTVRRAGERLAAAPSLFAHLAAWPASEWLPFTFELDEAGRPEPLVARLELAVGEAALLRTVRLCEGGGGAFALLQVADAQTLQLEVLRLDPALSRLPRAADDDVVAQMGATSGRVLLFPRATTGHPAWCSFDALHADRDHLEWSVARRREFVHETAASATTARLLARGLGGARCLDVVIAPDPAASDARAPAWLEWREVAADALAPDAVAGHPIVVLDASFEPRAGAFVVARDPARTSGLDRALFARVSDERGAVALPVERRAAADALEVVAFTVGPNARSGRRTGVQASVGGETVVLLDARERCTVAVTPPPGFLTWVGLEVASGWFRLPLPADGVLVLPALREPATLHLAEPYLVQTTALELLPDPAPESRLALAATRAPAR
ncbi:MAG: hypothetical protein JNL90_20400 [Planctomycetes bacterium]|nr:hypothetical protein [Planctomycetota bacterium]